MTLTSQNNHRSVLKWLAIAVMSALTSTCLATGAPALAADLLCHYDKTLKRFVCEGSDTQKTSGGAGEDSGGARTNQRPCYLDANGKPKLGRDSVRDCAQVDRPAQPVVPTGVQISEAVTRYAPVPAATAGGYRYVVGASVVFYARGPKGESVDRVVIDRIPLLGRTLRAELTLTSTDWNWGDGTSSPGQAGSGVPYTDAMPCESVRVCQAPYIGHTFTVSGQYTVTVTAHWTARITMDGRPVPTVGNGLQRTDPVGHEVTLLRARSVLVPR